MTPQEEIIEIFKKDEGFKRLFSLFLKKYNSYERVEKGISVILQNPAEYEKQAISGLLGEDYSKHQSIKVHAGKIERELLKTKYGKQVDNISFQDILEGYYGRPLVSRREVTETFISEREAYFTALKHNTASEMFIRLIEWILSSKNNRFYQLYAQDIKQFKIDMKYIEKAFDMMPLDPMEYLPVFASKITGDPHGFDTNRTSGKMFINALQAVYMSYDKEWSIHDLNAEERTQILYHYGIMPNDLLNYVSVFHVVGENKNGRENKLLAGAAEERAFIHLPLKEVAKLKKVESASQDNCLYVIENASVASYVTSELVKAGDEKAVISGNGQFKIATLKLMDVFISGGGIIYYSGDYDPEGILMAYKLKQRYGDQLIYWGFETELYHQSNPSKHISDRRLSQLKKIEDDNLRPLIESLSDNKKIGYQEEVMEELLRGIKSGKL